ncbi:MAG TPA: hypothetical protein VHZ53_12975 [Steroidobacteraceae bacterium]|nr:hypothetical protein [Steroidobacteraceae bacterium]
MTPGRSRRTDWPALAVLAVLVSASLFRLMALPAFEDEGTQLRLVWRIVTSGEWLQPLAEGKPLEAWPMVPLAWLGLPLLESIRAVHVLAGFLAAACTFRIALLSGCGRAGALAAGALFALCPFAVYLERLALSDMLLCAAAAWALLRALELLDAPTPANAAALAAAWVFGALAKMPVGFVLVIHVPLALAAMGSAARRRLLLTPTRKRLLAAYVPVAALAVVVDSVALWRLHAGRPPGFGLQDLIGLGGGGYANVAAILGIARPNLAFELAAQLTWPVVAAALIGICAGVALGGARERWLAAAAALPLLAIGLLAHFWFPRYLLFTFPPLIVVAVRGWQILARAGASVISARWVPAGACVVSAALMARQSLELIVDPVAARWSRVDRIQYIEGWSSGYGYPEAARFIAAREDAPAHVYSLDGHGAYQLRTYLPDSWSKRVTPVFYADDGRALTGEAQRLDHLIAHAPAWILVAEPLLGRYLESSFGAARLGRIEIVPVASFAKPQSDIRLAIYEVRCRKEAPTPRDRR